MLFARYMALVEPRNGGTKTLCKRLSPGKQEIMIFIDNVAPRFYTRVSLENPGQNISYTYLHDNCIFNGKFTSGGFLAPLQENPWTAGNDCIDLGM